MKKHIFIIKHLEPSLFPWCLIEYKNISKIVGKNNSWFTNIKKQTKASKKLQKYGKVIRKSVKDLNLTNPCVLDPESPITLTPKYSKNIKYFIFGGILGDYPPKKRTKKELTKFIKNASKRNIGKKQFSTDNAVFVVSQITRGLPYNKMKFQNKLEISINRIESVILPYYYPIINNKPKISHELVKFIRNKRGF